MAFANPMEKLAILPSSRASAQIGPYVTFAGALALALLVLLRFGAEPTVVASLFFGLAAVVAVAAWRKPRKGRRLTYWDVAGALTLIGILIAATIEPEQVVQLVAGAGR